MRIKLCNRVNLKIYFERKHFDKAIRGPNTWIFFPGNGTDVRKVVFKTGLKVQSHGLRKHFPCFAHGASLRGHVEIEAKRHEPFAFSKNSAREFEMVPLFGHVPVSGQRGSHGTVCVPWAFCESGGKNPAAATSRPATPPLSRVDYSCALAHLATSSILR